MSAGSPYRDLALDVRSERELRVFRAIAATVVGSVAVLVIALSPGFRGWACGAVSLLFALGWGVAARRARGRIEAREDWVLGLRPSHLELREGPGRAESVPWSDVGRVEVDEERLVVTVARGEGVPPLRIEPRFGGLGAYELAAAVEAARRAATDAPPEEAG